jgi:hypothetical protein
MPTEPRVYTPAYARRLAYGAAHGRTRAESRGHVSSAFEKQQRQINSWSKKAAGDVPLKPYTDKGQSKPGFTALRQSVQKQLIAEYGPVVGREKMLEHLKMKAAFQRDMQKKIRQGESYMQAAQDSGAHEWYEARDESIDVEWYFYHSE